MTDTGEIATIVERAIAANPDVIAAYKNGKTQALGTIVGWIMKETKGKADPAKANAMVRENMDRS